MYCKPEIIMQGSGLRAIQGHNEKTGCDQDATTHNSNGCGYEADE